MAAATLVGKRRVTIWGDKRVVMAQVTMATSGDTYVTGLKAVQQLSCEPTTAVASGTTFSGGTVTFIGTGPITFNLIAVGY